MMCNNRWIKHLSSGWDKTKSTLEDSTQVFQGKEVDLMIEETMSDYEEKGSLAALAIVL